MLQLPLLVAAAAHYSGAAATAPRPVYLDEAFAGIDAQMRGRCMGLLTSLDLDVVMASHDEWGFHEEVPGVATYQLFRSPGLPGVLTTPIVWDGRDRHSIADPALLGGGDWGIDWPDSDDLEDEDDPFEDEDTLEPIDPDPDDETDEGDDD